MPSQVSTSNDFFSSLRKLFLEEFELFIELIPYAFAFIGAFLSLSTTNKLLKICILLFIALFISTLIIAAIRNVFFVRQGKIYESDEESKVSRITEASGKMMVLSLQSIVGVYCAIVLHVFIIGLWQLAKYIVPELWNWLTHI
jgi:hypothetical protein